MADDALTEDSSDAPVQASGPLATMRQNFDRLTQRQKIAGGAALAVAIALIVGVMLWTRQPDYGVLFSNLSEKDGGAIVTALQQQNIPYKFSDNGTAILVPPTMVHDLRFRLAAQGLPQGGQVGFELMENQKLGVSQFHEQINYQRALEGELSRTIQSLAAVKTARVHLAIPKQTAFLRDEQKPTASVALSLHPGRILDRGQIAGIVHLVASSVPQLSNDNVSVVDQNGVLLTQKPDHERTGLDAKQLQYVEELEKGYIKRIDNILTPMFGPRNFSAQVSVDVDFDQTEQTSETYRPNPSPDQAIRSQQTNESLTTEEGPQGVPGALTNQPPAPATAPVTTPAVAGSGGTSQGPKTSTKTATVNYEVDKTIQHVKKSLGQVRRLSVAVVVNYKEEKSPKGEVKTVPLNDEEIKRVSDLVRDAVGVNKDRGDSLSVASSPFNPDALKDVETPFWKNPENFPLFMELAKYLIIAIAVGAVAFGVIRPLLRQVMPPPPEPETPGSDVFVPGTTGEGEEGGETGEVGPDGERPPTYEERLAWARQLAKENPKLVANLIKEWMHTDEQ